MTKPPAWPFLVLLMTVLGACSATKPHSASRLEWQKSSVLAPHLEEARQNCKVQVAADALGTQERPAAVSADFVNCMRAAGWTLLDHGAE